jgi:hypothetical protein
MLSVLFERERGVGVGVGVLTSFGCLFELPGCCTVLYSTITMTAACGDFAPNGKGGYNTMMDEALQNKCKRGGGGV